MKTESSRVACAMATALLVVALGSCTLPIGEDIVAYDDDALALIASRVGPVSDNATDAFFRWIEGIDHNCYCSYTLPVDEARGKVEKSAAAHNGVARSVASVTSQFGFEAFPETLRPARWHEHYWNVAAIRNGLVFEKRHYFVCADLDTGRVYCATWSE